MQKENSHIFLVFSFLSFTGKLIYASTSTDEPIIPNVACGEASKLYDECFTSLKPMFGVNIPNTEAEIKTQCRIFTRGVQCTERYIEQCFKTTKQKSIVENEIYGGKQFYKHLCNDSHFQREFLRHSSCIGYISQDWNKCNVQYKSILKEEINRTSDKMQFLHFCCARFHYEQCIFTQAKYKCRDASANFTAKVAKMLSTEKQLTSCDSEKIEQSFCANIGRTEQLLSTLLAVCLLLVGLSKNSIK